MNIQNLNYIDTVQNSYIQGGFLAVSDAGVSVVGLGPSAALFNVLASGLAIDVINPGFPSGPLTPGPGIYTDTAFGSVIGGGAGLLGFGANAGTLIAAL